MNSVTGFLWRTSASSYLRTLLRVALGLGTFRLLYRALPSEDFGFWALLWSVFGYGVLVDFGLGFATQKRVAELSARKDWNELSRVLSTVLVTFCCVGAVLLCGAIFGRDAVLRLLHVSPENAVRYRGVVMVFFVGMALGFPLGIFPEILRGQQRVSAVNLIVCGGLVLNFIGIFAAVKLGWSLTTIVTLALITTLGPDLVCAVVAMRSLPGVRLHPARFSMSTARQTMTFSIVAYLITATNIVLGKTDQLVLGTCLSVASVAVYVAGAKVAEIFSLFTRQLHEALSPAAARLHANGDRDSLRTLLVEGTRLGLLIALPLYALFALRLPVFMRVLTGDATSHEAWLTGQLLLAWFLTTVATHATTKRIFVMTGHEHRLLTLGIIEAIANLALSITFVKMWPHPASVALGSLIPGLLLGWAVMWPWAARESGMSAWILLRKTAGLGTLAAVTVAGALQISSLIFGHGSAPTLPVFLIESVAAAAAGFAAVAPFLHTELKRFRAQKSASSNSAPATVPA